MTAQTQIMIWGLAAVAPLFLNMATKRRADAVGLAAMLLATWCLGRIMGAMFTVPESMTLYPVEDALCGTIAFIAWRTQREWWKLALSGLFVTQCILHAAFWAAWDSGAHQALLFYLAANNSVFALELLVVGWGALVHVARDLGHGFSGLARQLHPERHYP